MGADADAVCGRLRAATGMHMKRQRHGTRSRSHLDDLLGGKNRRIGGARSSGDIPREGRTGKWASNLFQPRIEATHRSHHALGIITVARLVIGLGSAMREPPWHCKAIEDGVALAVVAAMAGIVISLPPEPWKTVVPVALLFPLLLWLAPRCRPIFASAAAFIVSPTIV